MGIASHLNDRVYSPVDGGAGITHGHGHRVHQKGDVIGNGAQRGEAAGATGRLKVNQGFAGVALVRHQPVLLGNMEELFRRPGRQRGQTAHFIIGSEKAAKQRLVVSTDVGSDLPFQLGLQQRLALSDVILHRNLRRPCDSAKFLYTVSLQSDYAK